MKSIIPDWAEKALAKEPKFTKAELDDASDPLRYFKPVKNLTAGQVTREALKILAAELPRETITLKGRKNGRR